MAEQPKSNILKALEGLPVTTNQPKSRILQAIEDGGSGGGGGSYDDSELRRRIEALENHDNTIKALIAQNQQNIELMKNAINRLHSDYLDYEPISSGVCLSKNSALPIQTGYKMNGDFEFIVTGHTTAAGKGCLIGAYQANNARTTMQLLGESKKLQGQWAANRELTVEQATALGLPDDYLYNQNTFKINKNGVFIKQNDDWFQLVENSGYSGTGDHPFIYLLGDRQDHTAHYGVLYYAEILDTYGNTAATFIPAKNKVTAEIVVLQTDKHQSAVLRPISGNLKEFVNE